MNIKMNPYQSPQAITKEVFPGKSTEKSYKSWRFIVAATSIFFVAGIIANLLCIYLALNTFHEIEANSTQYSGFGELLQVVAIGHFPHGLASVALWIINAFSLVVFLFWFYRAHQNLWKLYRRQTGFKSSWSVMCFFVPLINFFAPYQVMKEVYEKSILQERVPNNSPPGTKCIALWWGLCVATLLAWIFLWWKVHHFAEVQTITWLDVICHLFEIAVVSQTIFVVRRIDRAQMKSLDIS